MYENQGLCFQWRKLKTLIRNYLPLNFFRMEQQCLQGPFGIWDFILPLDCLGHFCVGNNFLSNYPQMCLVHLKNKIIFLQQKEMSKTEEKD